MTYQKAAFIYPPLHPSLPYYVLLEQSTICCGEKLYKTPLTNPARPYKAPHAENAQHDPHEPWFLTAVTARPVQSKL
jgi:hypothetical protein